MISRRALMKSFGASLLSRSAFAGQAREPEFVGLDHIEFFVAGGEKARDLFVKAFGDDLKNRNGKRYLKLGSAYMAFEEPRGNGGQTRLDHFSVAVKRLNMAELHVFLTERNIEYRDYPSGRNTGITASDNRRTQLSPENGWS